MKRTHTTLIASAILLVATLTGCGNKQQIVFEGTLENGAGKVIYIEEMTPDSRLFIDSVTLDSKGHFRFKYDMPYKTFYNLHVSEHDYVVVSPDYGETIEIAGDYNQLSKSYTLKGGRDSQLLWQLQDYSNQGAEVLSDIVATDSKNRQLLADGDMSQQEYDHEREVTDSIYLATFAEQQQYVVHFIEDNLGSVERAVGDMSDAAINAWNADSVPPSIALLSNTSKRCSFRRITMPCAVSCTAVI